MIGGLMRRAARVEKERTERREKEGVWNCGMERADVGEWLDVKQEAVPTKRTY